MSAKDQVNTVIIFVSHGNLMGIDPAVIPILQMSKLKCRKESDSSKVRELVSGLAEIWAQWSVTPQAVLLNTILLD